VSFINFSWIYLLIVTRQISSQLSLNANEGTYGLILDGDAVPKRQLADLERTIAVTMATKVWNGTLDFPLAEVIKTRNIFS
jgi:hypothetical protein